MQIEEREEDRDSEDPDETMNGAERAESEINEDRYMPMDPRLEAKIQQIRQGISSGEDKEDPYHMKPLDRDLPSPTVVSKSSFGPSNQNAATTIDDQSTSKNLSKLEEVLRRQRERLESISG